MQQVREELQTQAAAAETSAGTHAAQALPLQGELVLTFSWHSHWFYLHFVLIYLLQMTIKREESYSQFKNKKNKVELDRIFQIGRIRILF